MKVAGSGVSNVSEADRSHDADHDGRGSNRVRSSCVGVGGTMKGKNGTNDGEVVYLEDYRIREPMHCWARDHDMHRAPDVRS